MIKENNFDDIRPYMDAEIPAAMNRIATSSFLPILAGYVFPDKTLDEVRQMVSGFKTVKDFQLGVMYYANKEIIRKSITELTVSGIELLNPNEAYLFISNHRDIMLDASLLQNILVDNGFDTTEITFGANLMMNQLVVDIGKSNKMFRVERPTGNMKDFYNSSKHLSDYLRHTICDNKHSVWIAQRNGRTKDGNDKTDQGIIKMFAMSEADNKIRAIDQLHLVPVSVSYEWESCDILKALELYESLYTMDQTGVPTKYTKKPGEDLNSILTGIAQQKGRVHFEICKPIEKMELMQFEIMTKSDYHKAVAQLVDKRIIPAYRLFPNNYIAYDILYGCTSYSHEYTPSEKEAFMNYMQNLEMYDSCDTEKLKDLFLRIYANPVINKD